MEIKQFDVVKLKDGQEGTVLEVFKVPSVGYLVEIDGGETVTVGIEEIDKIVWNSK
ncbi:MAG TPA: DUF4926 domain-containing protein [Bacillus bacterium]|nr:DUF4926 domain-containing protein [Bacillus sp. (in: firmicutes)]